ncbi:Uncharacterized protein FKW44_006442 [Caligus rogercresseyi]|uniref:Uncharacterized protein n=1 Tax=Caligus rogercresseyi TaxID=217165 RepID=A0A7T8QSV6_CALRO|nr:Uncharacterized protein FKW44_006442 [Caligus rogercresseyi]
MSLGFVASSRDTMPLIGFPRGFRLNAATYIEELRTKLLPLVQATFTNQEVVFQ